MVISNTVTVISAVNECVTFVKWVKSLWSNWNRKENQEEDDVPKLQSSLGSHSSGTEKQELKEDVLKLQSFFQCLRLRDTLPAMYNFTNQAERRSHEKGVAELLPELKAAVCDMEDLVEVFRCYEQKVKIEGSVTLGEPGTKFFHNFIQGSFSKLIHIQQRLCDQYRLLEGMSLHQATPRFDRPVRPETTSFPTEATIFGNYEIKGLIRMLRVPANNSRDPSEHKRCRFTFLIVFDDPWNAKEEDLQRVRRILQIIVPPTFELTIVPPTWEPQHFANTSAGTQAATSFHIDVPPMWPPPMSRRQRGQIDSDSSILKMLEIVLCMNKDMINALHREKQTRKRDSRRIKRDVRQIKKLRTESGKAVSPSESEAEELEIESEDEQCPDFDALISQVWSEQQHGQSYALGGGGGYGYGFGIQFHPGASSSSALLQHQQYGQSYAPSGGYGFPYGFGGQFHPGASSSSALQQHQQYGQTYAPGGGYGYGFGGQFHPGASSSALQQPPSQCQ